MDGITNEKLEPITADEKEKLLQPLPAEAIDAHPSKSYLSTIKAIYVVERLNDVFGIAGWNFTTEVLKDEYVEDNSGKGTRWVVMRGILRIRNTQPIMQYGGNDNIDLGDAYKGAATDCLTKCASYLGIGIDVFKGLVKPPKKTPYGQQSSTRVASSPSAQKVAESDDKLVGTTCQKCGRGIMKMSSKGNLYCSNRCWMKPEPRTTVPPSQEDIDFNNRMASLTTPPF